jgi:uncharacterized protein (DUF2141 family)
MSFSKYLKLAFFISLLSPALVLAELPSVRVVVSGLSPAAGTVEVSLFDSAETFMIEPSLQQSGTAGEDGSFETEFVSLADGEYAVIVVHDANDNGELDSGFLGFGGESYGYSNNVRPWFGRPDFEDVKIMVDQPGTLVEIDLK